MGSYHIIESAGGVRYGRKKRIKSRKRPVAVQRGKGNDPLQRGWAEFGILYDFNTKHSYVQKCEFLTFLRIFAIIKLQILFRKYEGFGRKEYT